MRQDAAFWCDLLLQNAQLVTPYQSKKTPKNCAHSFSQFGNMNLTVQCFFFYFRQQWNRALLMHERFPSFTAVVCQRDVTLPSNMWHASCSDGKRNLHAAWVPVLFQKSAQQQIKTKMTDTPCLILPGASTLHFHSDGLSVLQITHLNNA